MRSIKTKFVVAISLLIVLVFTANALLMVQQKATESKKDIFISVRNFTQFTTKPIIADFDAYFRSGVKFNESVQKILSLSEEVVNLQVINYNGEIIFDAVADRDQRYQGEPRLVDKQLLERVQDVEATYQLVGIDKFDYFKRTEPTAVMIKDVVQPYLDDNSRHDYSIRYEISYAILNQRIAQMTMRTALIAIIGVLFGILVAFFLAGRITGPLKRLKEGALRIAKGNFNYQIKVKSKDEVGTLADTFNQMALDLDKYQKELVAKEHLAHELKIATKIQEDLLPKKLPQLSNLDIAAKVIPAADVGGDCYDFIELDDNNTLIYIGDVTGHGVASGVVVAIANALIYGFSQYFKNPRDVLVNANAVIKAKTQANMFITMVMGGWNKQNREFTYTSAGHDQMVLYRAATKEISLSQKGGMALGMLPDISKIVKENKIKLEKDDVLVMYTDGVIEAWRSEKELYELDKLKKLVSEIGHLPTASEILDAIFQDVKDFMGDYPQQDDITVVVMKGK